MNDFLKTFVSDTEAGFTGRLKTPQDLMRRKSSLDDFVDTAVLAGYSVADILHGSVPESSIDPEVILAFHLQYPNTGEFLPFIQSHSGDDAAIAGIVNGIKGKLFELEYVNWLNEGHLPAGAVAELASSPTQEGWDIAIRDSDGHIIDHLQLKATESLAYIKDALAAHPDIDIVSTHEVFQHLDGSGLEDHVTVAQISDADLTEHVHGQVDAVDLSPEFHLPLVAFGIIALQTYRRYKGGDVSAVEAVRQGFRRGSRSFVCRGAAYASVLISGEPIVGLPTAVLSRLIFSRFDVHNEFSDFMSRSRLEIRDRHQHLLLSSQ